MKQLTVFLLYTLGIASADVKSVFERAQIVPDVIDRAPLKEIEIKYGNKRVSLGNELTPTETKDVPEVHYHHECRAFYTLALIDPDVKLDGNSTVYDHWLVGNILGDKVAEGEALTEYVGAAPPQGDRKHRYVFLLYKQKQGSIKFGEIRITNRDNNGRAGFSIGKFAVKHNLEGPIAGDFYTARYDSYVPKIYSQLGLTV